jgi:hypothetical protein
MGPFILAWLTGEAIILFRSYRSQGGPPWPGQMIWASGAFAVLAIVGEFGQGARTVAITTAWGLNVAAFLNLWEQFPPKLAGKNWWDVASGVHICDDSIFGGSGHCGTSAAGTRCRSCR